MAPLKPLGSIENDKKVDSPQPIPVVGGDRVTPHESFGKKLRDSIPDFTLPINKPLLTNIDYSIPCQIGHETRHQELIDSLKKFRNLWHITPTAENTPNSPSGELRFEGFDSAILTGANLAKLTGLYQEEIRLLTSCWNERTKKLEFTQKQASDWQIIQNEKGVMLGQALHDFPEAHKPTSKNALSALIEQTIAGMAAAKLKDHPERIMWLTLYEQIKHVPPGTETPLEKLRKSEMVIIQSPAKAEPSTLKLPQLEFPEIEFPNTNLTEGATKFLNNTNQALQNLAKKSKAAPAPKVPELRLTLEIPEIELPPITESTAKFLEEANLALQKLKEQEMEKAPDIKLTLEMPKIKLPSVDLNPISKGAAEVLQQANLALQKLSKSSNHASGSTENAGIVNVLTDADKTKDSPKVDDKLETVEATPDLKPIIDTHPISRNRPEPNFSINDMAQTWVNALMDPTADITKQWLNLFKQFGMDVNTLKNKPQATELSHLIQYRKEKLDALFHAQNGPPQNIELIKDKKLLSLNTGQVICVKTSGFPELKLFLSKIQNPLTFTENGEEYTSVNTLKRAYELALTETTTKLLGNADVGIGLVQDIRDRAELLYLAMSNDMKGFSEHPAIQQMGRRMEASRLKTLESIPETQHRFLTPSERKECVFLDPMLQINKRGNRFPHAELAVKNPAREFPDWLEKELAEVEKVSDSIPAFREKLYSLYELVAAEHTQKARAFKNGAEPELKKTWQTFFADLKKHQFTYTIDDQGQVTIVDPDPTNRDLLEQIEVEKKLAAAQAQTQDYLENSANISRACYVQLHGIRQHITQILNNKPLLPFEKPIREELLASLDRSCPISPEDLYASMAPTYGTSIPKFWKSLDLHLDFASEEYKKTAAAACELFDKSTSEGDKSKIWKSIQWLDSSNDGKTLPASTQLMVYQWKQLQKEGKLPAELHCSQFFQELTAYGADNNYGGIQAFLTGREKLLEGLQSALKFSKAPTISWENPTTGKTIVHSSSLSIGLQPVTVKLQKAFEVLIGPYHKSELGEILAAEKGTPRYIPMRDEVRQYCQALVKSGKSFSEDALKAIPNIREEEKALVSALMTGGMKFNLPKEGTALYAANETAEILNRAAQILALSGNKSALLSNRTQLAKLLNLPLESLNTAAIESAVEKRLNTLPNATSQYEYLNQLAHRLQPEKSPKTTGPQVVYDFLRATCPHHADRLFYHATRDLEVYTRDMEKLVGLSEGALNLKDANGQRLTKVPYALYNLMENSLARHRRNPDAVHFVTDEQRDDLNHIWNQLSSEKRAKFTKLFDQIVGDHLYVQGRLEAKSKDECIEKFGIKGMLEKIQAGGAGAEKVTLTLALPTGSALSNRFASINISSAIPGISTSQTVEFSVGSHSSGVSIKPEPITFNTLRVDLLRNELEQLVQFIRNGKTNFVINDALSQAEDALLASAYSSSAAQILENALQTLNNATQNKQFYYYPKQYVA